MCCAEKGVFRFTLTTDGVAGHASIPRMGDNALLKMAPLLERLGERQPDFDVDRRAAPRCCACSRATADDPAAALERAARAPTRSSPCWSSPCSASRVTPTRVSASEKINVIPAARELQVDCRVPPGLGEDEARARIDEVLGADGYRLEFHEQRRGQPLAGGVAADGRDRATGSTSSDPGADVVPTMLPGFTDSRWFRDAFPDCVAYGFFPQRHMTLHELRAADPRRRRAHRRARPRLRRRASSATSRRGCSDD